MTMNHENKPSVNSSAPPQYVYPSMYPQRNTINLAGFWRVIIKQKKIISISVIAFLVLGIAVAVMKPAVYSFSTIVQIGTIDHEGKTELIESTETALNKIISAYIPLVLAEFYEKNPSHRGEYKIDVSIPKKSDILLIDGRGPLDKGAVYKKLISNVVHKLVEDHSRTASVKIKNYEVSISHAENVLASSKDTAKLISDNVDRLNKTTELLRVQLNEKKQLLASTLKNRNKVNTNNATGAMSVLLIDSEIQRYQQMIDNLEKYLLIDSNHQRSEIEKSLADNLRSQSDHQNTIDQLKNALANISNTKAVVPVMTSMTPVGVGKSGLVIAITLLGGLLGITAAFLYEFYQNYAASTKK